MTKYSIIPVVVLSVTFLFPIKAQTKENNVLTYEHAVGVYEKGDYVSSIRLFDKLIDELKLNSMDRILMAHSILGACHFFLDNFEKAKEHLATAINLSPSYKLDIKYFPPKVVKLFNDIKKERTLKIKAGIPVVPYKDYPSKVKPPKEKVRKVSNKPTIKTENVFEETDEKLDSRKRNPFPNCFVPFGIAQFKNNEPFKGYVFLSTQLFTLTSTIATISTYYGIRNSDGTFDDPSLARGLKAGFYTSLIFYLYSTTLGIVDALVNYNEFPFEKPDKNRLSLVFEPDEKGVLIGGKLIF